MAANANIVISAVDNASRVLSGVGKAAGGMGNALAKSLSVASDLTIATAGLVRATQTLGRALAVPIQLATEQEKVERQLAAVLQSTGHAAGLTATELKGMAAGLQQATAFGDEAVIGAQNLLLTFTNIGGAGGVFERTTETVLDVASAMGMDLNSAALQVGKALNDPATGLSMLTRVGITFSEEQKEVIKALQATGDMAGAQSVILEELERQFGGSASAAAETFGGTLAQLQNTWGDLLETIGSFMTQNEGVKALLRELTAGVQEWNDGIQDLTGSQEGQVKVAELMRSAMVGVLEAAQGMVTGFGFLGGVIFDVVTGIAELRGEMIPLTKEQREVADELNRLESELEGARSAAALLEETFLADAEAAEENRRYILELERALDTGRRRYDEVTESAGDFTGATTEATDALQAMIDRLNKVDVEGAVAAGAADGLAQEFRDLEVMADRVAGTLTVATVATEDLSSGWSELVDELQREADVEELAAEFDALAEALDEASTSAADWQAFMDELAQEEAAANLADEFRDLANAMQEAEEVPTPAQRLAEEIPKAEDAWERSLERMAESSADASAEVVQNFLTGQESLREGFKDFGAEAKETLADAFVSPILGAESPMKGVFESALKPVNSLGRAISDKIFGGMISGLLSYFGVKKTQEAADAAASAGIQATAAAGIVGVQQTAVGAMMPALSAAASAALIATFGGAATAAGLLPGILSTAAAQGKATATALSAVPFADGGYVTERTYATMGEGGQAELVLPLSKPDRARELLAELPRRAPGLAGGGGTTINNVTVEIVLSGSNMTPEDVAAAVDEALGSKLGV